MKTINLLLFILTVLLINSCKTSEIETSKSNAKEITSIEISGISGSTSNLDKTTNTYTFSVPSNTDIKALALIIKLPVGATSSPSSGSVQNFTNPITYTITAEDGTKTTYIVKIILQSHIKSSENQILNFSFEDFNPILQAAIDQTSNTITITFPAATNIKSLKPTIKISEKASVSPSSGTQQDFSKQLQYTVKSEDGNFRVYNVIVTNNTISNAPSIIWEQTYGGSDYEQPLFFTKTNDNGFIFGGDTYSTKSGNKSYDLIGIRDFWLIKSKSNGEKEWDKYFDYIINSVLETPDKAIIVGGSYNRAMSVSKLDSKGKAIWGLLLQDPPSSFSNTIHQVTKIINLKDGNILVGGNYYPQAENASFWVSKLNQNGVILWTRQYGGSGDDVLTSLVELSDNSIIIGGSSNSTLSNLNNGGLCDYYVIKIKGDGSEVWQKKFGGNQNDILRDITESYDKNIILVGDSKSSNNGNKSIASIGSSDGWVLKIDLNGNKIWEKVMGSSSDDIIKSIIKNSNNQYTLTGFIQDSEKKGGWVIFMNENGSITKDYGLLPFGSSFISYASEVGNNEFVLFGETNSDAIGSKKSPNYGKLDYFIFRAKF